MTCNVGRWRTAVSFARVVDAVRGSGETESRISASAMTGLQQHVLLAGCEVHFVLVIVHADVDDVSQQLLVTWDHLQLLVKTLDGEDNVLQCG